MNGAEIKPPVTDPMVISTRDGGIVSVCAPVMRVAQRDRRALLPRFFISGNRTGATAAMSAALDPSTGTVHGSHRDVVETAADVPQEARKGTAASACHTVISISSPRKTKSGTARMRWLMPSSGG